MPHDQRLLPSEKKRNSPLWGSAFAVGLSIIFLASIWVAGRAGLASLLANYGVTANQLDAINMALHFAPDDPESHYLRGAQLEANGDLASAIAEYRHAASLRPDDYVLWLSLARACELNGDASCAIDAAKAAVPLAPYYAEPRWQLGNMLVRAGQRDEGFKELRLAGASNPALIPTIVDLAWQLSGGDAQFVVRAIAPASPEAHLALGDFFRRRGEINQSITSYHAAGPAAVAKRREFLVELIAAKKFTDAYRLWSMALTGDSGSAIGTLRDPGFEEEGDLEQEGFGWRRLNRGSNTGSNKPQTISLSLDSTQPRAGRSSLLVDFKGESAPGTAIISQLVLVAPGSRYQLTFAARTESVVSGGLPRLLLIDAGDDQQLASPVNFPQQSGGWQNYTIEFTTKDMTSAIVITCSRAACVSGPCPIFGRLWLDNLALRKL